MIRENRAKFPTKPLLQVEIGNYMQAVGNDRSVKNKWLWQGMEKLGIEVLNVGENDVAELQALGVDIKGGDRFISANLLSTATETPLLRPYVIKNISVGGSEKKYRLGFLGLAARDSYLRTEEAGYVWADPLASAKKWLPELRQKCDFLIVLACMPAKDAVQLAVDTNNIDMIVVGFKHQGGGLPARINQSTLVYAEDEGKILGELRFAGVRGEKVDVQPMTYALTRNIKDDPEMAALVSQAKEEISVEQRALANANVNTARPLQPAGVSPFMTAANCAACHVAAYQVWEKSRHAHAIEILKKEKKEFDSACVVCHVTGADTPAGFIDVNQTAHLANVQCEACHGSGREHSAKPAEAKLAKLTANTCIRCHTKVNSPDFEFVSYWEKIKH